MDEKKIQVQNFAYDSWYQIHWDDPWISSNRFFDLQIKTLNFHHNLVISACVMCLKFTNTHHHQWARFSSRVSLIVLILLVLLFVHTSK